MSVNVSPEPESESLSSKQQKLIAALLSGVTILDASKSIGIAEKTAHAWLKLPHVQAAYRDAQRSLFDASLSRLMLYTDDAIKTLHSIAKDQEETASSRVRAAQIILEQAIESHKMSELEQKIEQLERLIAEQGNNR